MVDDNGTDTGRLVEAQAADLPPIVDLLNAAYRGYDGPTGWTDERAILTGTRTSVERLSEQLLEKNPPHLLKWQVPCADDIIGCIRLEPMQDGVWYLSSFAVAPRYQNKGLGKAILGGTERWARVRGSTRLKMTVITVRTELFDWYIRRGYAPTGEISPFPYEDTTIGVPLKDDLQFAVLEKEI